MGEGAGRRVAALAGLLILAAVALHPAGTVAGSAGRTGLDAFAVVLAAVGGALAAGCLVVALRRLRTLQRPPAGSPGARRRPTVVGQILIFSLCAALLVSPAGSLVLKRLHGHFSPPPRTVATDEQQSQRRKAVHAARHPAPIPQAAALGAAIVLVGLLTVAVVRRRRPPVPTGIDNALELRRAVTPGVTALGEAGPGGGDSDPRERVIRCYAAMERVLAATGTPRRPADTPAELLARAVARGRVPAEPAAALTELFRRARYSRTPMTVPDLNDARRCLRALQDEVGAAADSAGVPDTSARGEASMQQP
jgi:Domain of unknown function (DUF4129)